MKDEGLSCPQMETVPFSIRKSLLVLCFLLVALVFVLYSPVLKNEFVDWDDYHLILQDPSLREFSLSSILNIFKDSLHLKYSRFIPLTFASFAFDFKIHGVSASGFHFTNLTIHLLNVILVFSIVFLLTDSRRYSWLTAFLFGIHPVNVETVAWISARAHLLLTLFYLSSLLFYCIAQKRLRGRIYFETLSLVSFILSLLSGPFAVTLPLVLLLLDYDRTKTLRIINFPLKAIYVALSALTLRMAFLAAHGSQALPDPFIASEVYSLPERMYLSSLTILFNLKNFFFPYPLSALWLIESFIDQKIIWIYPATLALGILAWLLKINGPSRIFKFGLLFFFATIPLSLQIEGASESLTNDRYMYIPSIGMMLIFAGVILNFWKFPDIHWRKVGRALSITIIAFLVLATQKQIHVWQNTATLWTDVIEKYPNAFPSYFSRGNYFLSKKNPSSAINDFQMAIHLKKDYWRAYQGLGRALIQTGELEKSVTIFSQAIQLSPGSSELYNDRGSANLLLGAYGPSLEDFNKALHLAPKDPAVLLNRGQLYILQNQYALAIEDFREVLERNPDDAIALRKMEEIRRKQK